MEDIFLNENGQIITDQGKVVNSSNKYYTTVAQNLVNNLGETNNIFQDYLKNPNEHSIFLNEIEPNEVLTIEADLNPKKSRHLQYNTKNFKNCFCFIKQKSYTDF